MNRSHLLFGIVGVVCVVAIGLRVRAYINRPNVELREPGSDPAHATLGSADLPPRPRDYVTDPWIHPDELTAGPKRIVTLAPNVTEIICALGLRDRIVGRSSFSKYPPGIQGIPSVGSLTDANLAKIKAMEPEIILLAANSGPLLGKLEQLQLPFEALPHEALADGRTLGRGDPVRYRGHPRVGGSGGHPAQAGAAGVWRDARLAPSDLCGRSRNFL
jgi:hypothetical protein